MKKWSKCDYLFKKQVEKEDARDPLEEERFDFDVMKEDLNEYTPNRKKFFCDKQKKSCEGMPQAYLLGG